MSAPSESERTSTPIFELNTALLKDNHWLDIFSKTYFKEERWMPSFSEGVAEAKGEAGAEGSADAVTVTGADAAGCGQEYAEPGPGPAYEPSLYVSAFVPADIDAADIDVDAEHFGQLVSMGFSREEVKRALFLGWQRSLMDPLGMDRHLINQNHIAVRECGGRVQYALEYLLTGCIPPPVYLPTGSRSKDQEGFDRSSWRRQAECEFNFGIHFERSRTCDAALKEATQLEQLLPILMQRAFTCGHGDKRISSFSSEKRFRSGTLRVDKWGQIQRLALKGAFFSGARAESIIWR